MKMLLDAELKDLLAEAYDNGQRHERKARDLTDAGETAEHVADYASRAREAAIQEAFDRA